MKRHITVALTREQILFLERVMDERLQSLGKEGQDEQDYWNTLFLQELFYNKSM